MRKDIVPGAKREGADLLEFAVPETADVVSGEKNSWQLQRVCEDRLYEINWLVGARNELQAESFQQNLQNNPVIREEAFLQIFLTNYVQLF